MLKAVLFSEKWPSGILEANFRILEVTHRWIWIWIYPICDYSMQYPVNKGEGFVVARMCWLPTVMSILSIIIDAQAYKKH